MSETISKIECKEIIYIYAEKGVKSPALMGLNYTFISGMLYTVFGPSGSGKTTMLDVIAGFLEPTSGVLKLNEQSLYKKFPKEIEEYRLNSISFITQQPIYVPFLTVEENISFAYESKYKIQITKEKLDEILHQVNIGHISSKYPEYLSGGEQQRLSISMALAINNPIWLCDEPTGSLDVKNKNNIMELLRKIHDSNKDKIIIIVTHDFSLGEFSDRVLFLKDGVLETELSRDEFKKYNEKVVHEGRKNSLSNARNKKILLKQIEQLKKQIDEN